MSSARIVIHDSRKPNSQLLQQPRIVLALMEEPHDVYQLLPYTKDENVSLNLRFAIA